MQERKAYLIYIQSKEFLGVLSQFLNLGIVDLIKNNKPYISGC
jgi:hypothetical protein